MPCPYTRRRVLQWMRMAHVEGGCIAVMQVRESSGTQKKAHVRHCALYWRTFRVYAIHLGFPSTCTSWWLLKHNWSHARATTARARHAHFAGCRECASDDVCSYVYDKAKIKDRGSTGGKNHRYHKYKPPHKCQCLCILRFFGFVFSCSFIFCMGIASSVLLSVPLIFKWAPAACLCLMIAECIEVYMEVSQRTSLHPSVVDFGAPCLAVVLLVVPFDCLNALVTAKDTLYHLKLMAVGDTEMVELEGPVYHKMRRCIFEPVRLLCLSAPMVYPMASLGGLCRVTLVVYSVLGFAYKKCLGHKPGINWKRPQSPGVDMLHRVHGYCY